jgi:hypothetical protein
VRRTRFVGLAFLVVTAIVALSVSARPPKLPPPQPSAGIAPCAEARVSTCSKFVVAGRTLVPALGATLPVHTGQWLLVRTTDAVEVRAWLSGPDGSRLTPPRHARGAGPVLSGGARRLFFVRLSDRPKADPAVVTMRIEYRAHKPIRWRAPVRYAPPPGV